MAARLRRPLIIRQVIAASVIITGPRAKILTNLTGALMTSWPRPDAPRGVSPESLSGPTERDPDCWLVTSTYKFLVCPVTLEKRDPDCWLVTRARAYRFLVCYVIPESQSGPIERDLGYWLVPRTRAYRFLVCSVIPESQSGPIELNLGYWLVPRTRAY
ncbi:hypothetical protein J6590_014410 [Homalodisca vitripennis]|nr:hypothetical protein J6590_014410 [Homalodisca vitripennis]